jgi:hypothetical protein
MAARRDPRKLGMTDDLERYGVPGGVGAAPKSGVGVIKRAVAADGRSLGQLARRGRGTRDR